MSSDRALRGSCHCGRNQYVVVLPEDSAETAQIRFSEDLTHRVSQATTLPAFLRVPIEWYHSQTFAFYPDESRSSIRRTFSHPAEQHSIRQFCGYCGTPLSYWTESPRSEANYIQLTLGSLLSEDLRDLEELGLLESDSDEDRMDIATTSTASSELELIPRELTGLPWFNDIVAGSRLGNMRSSRGIRQSRDGTIKVEWEISEWTGDDDGETSESSVTGKRKRQNSEGATTAGGH